MEGSNREAIQRVFAANQGVDVAPAIRASLKGDATDMPSELAAGFAAWLDLLDPEIEIDTSDVEMPGFGVLRGPKGVRELFSRWIEEWDHYSWTHSGWTELDEHVIVDVEIRATGKASGADVIWPHCQVWTFRDGKIIRWGLFDDRASALAAIENS